MAPKCRGIGRSVKLGVTNHQDRAGPTWEACIACMRKKNRRVSVRFFQIEKTNSRIEAHQSLRVDLASDKYTIGGHADTQLEIAVTLPAVYGPLRSNSFVRYHGESLALPRLLYPFISRRLSISDEKLPANAYEMEIENITSCRSDGRKIYIYIYISKILLTKFQKERIRCRRVWHLRSIKALSSDVVSFFRSRSLFSSWSWL